MRERRESVPRAITRECVSGPPTVLAKPVVVQYRGEQRQHTHVIPSVMGVWAPRMDPHRNEGEQSPLPPNLRCKRFDPHQYAPPVRGASRRDSCDLGRFLPLVPGSARGVRLIHIQELDEGNLTGTPGMVGPVVIDVRERTYRRNIQAGARGRG